MTSESVIPFKPDTPGVRSARLRSLVCYWTKKRGDRPMPSRDDIDPLEIPGLLPIALLADVAGTRARIRLLGTEATAAYGAECRGTLLDDIELGDFTSASTKILSMVLVSRKPAAAAGAFESGRELNRVEMVLTPLSYDGHAISHIFGGLIIKPVARIKLIERQMPITYISNAVDAGISRTAR
jgi:hypothetical protein